MHEEFLRRAIQLAVENVELGRGGPFGALIVKDGTILAEGANHVTTLNDPTAHAEVVAIREACRKLNTFELRGCTIFASCEPCPMCLSAIYWARVDALYYAASKDDASAAGFDDSFLYVQIPLDEKDRSLPTQRLLPDEGDRPFAIWRSSVNKIPY
ncbi:nucleoside deaminase [Paludibaculum fermentans]|uniref:Nucleoside deaminase n=1 Tax=Paludibaculum fermentans TaxID=1473598 RepID=A0A7S7SK17_PALFE|nr:nucleoside deaminase [Paludibaculum fermentans]QOY87834.1 nucleoside deaminase [Paludibaculum fermentans]